MEPAKSITPTLDAAERRRLAVKADCDPRTIAAVAEGRRVRGLVAERARKVLVEAGYAVPSRASSENE